MSERVAGTMGVGNKEQCLLIYVNVLCRGKNEVVNIGASLTPYVIQTSQTRNTEVPRAGGIKPSRRQEAFSLSLSEAAEGLSLVELPARGEDSKGKLGHSVFEERENDLGDVEGRRVLGSGERESDSEHGDRERVLGGCSLGDGKRKLEAGENVGAGKFDIDQALVKELTPNQGGLRFLSECPPFKKAISVSAGFEAISAEGFEAISAEGFEAISVEGFQAESA
ncbi:hypothetical protein R1sor_024284 [Riccia sorocarpa]|uniref:Uncharacterized protein n=1 Tax=Riccia sorocarpa TaxID=122646 RepID=A0ABD3GQ89_9MARC